MIYKRRDGTMVRANDGQDRFLKMLYGSGGGRALVRLMISPCISRAAGRYLGSRFSRWMIAPFVRKNSIDLNCFQKQEFYSYNDFFTRRINEAERPVDEKEEHFVSPCDGKLSVYPVTAGGILRIKHTPYTVEGLLRSQKLARRYYGGQALVFRLTVDDYHRYCYAQDAEKSRNYSIAGVLHTVNPIANDKYPIYKENAREFCLLQTKKFKTVLAMEVGAMMVGKIHNHQRQEAFVRRGEEKGYFAFGGSTVILLVQKDVLRVDEDILENSREQVETIVRLGEKIGVKTGFEGL